MKIIIGKGGYCMNKERRVKLKNGLNKLEEVESIIQDVLSDEQFAFDNLSEGLQQTMRGEQMEENINILEESIDKIEEILNDLYTLD